MNSFEQFISENRNSLNIYAKEYIENLEIPELLKESIIYSLVNDGKKIRPLSFLYLLKFYNIDYKEYFDVALAIELVHTYSLVHDDLPEMDNDDYRRGRLTNHKVYGEDLAILAGDALFLDPYALIAQADLPSQTKVDLIANLSLASGSMGMVAGQVLDMEGEHQCLSLDELQTIHANKTGKLLAYPFQAAAIIAELAPELQAELKTVGELVGLAFQVRDDVLDVTAGFEEIGKTPQKDLQAEKSTYPALLGLDEAKEFCNQTLDQANIKLEEIAQQVNFDKEPIVKIVESLRVNG